jgi:hypothetical protein
MCTVNGARRGAQGGEEGMLCLLNQGHSVKKETKARLASNTSAASPPPQNC